jgi:C4-dicarboxylate-specific signal transduction histidine kinase
VGKGLGLGLSISYNIVHDFGGRLEVANAPDGGAVFTLTLPLVERA